MVRSLDTFKFLEISLNFHISQMGPLITIVTHKLIKSSSLLQQFLRKTLLERKFLGKTCKYYIIINMVENSILYNLGEKYILLIK